MKKYYSCNSIYFLFLVGLFINFCQGQINTSAPKEKYIAPKQSPKIIGTPPSLVPNPTPTNDPSLVSQYIRTIFQDSKGNYWFGPAGQSVARYDEKTLQYYSRTEFFHGNSKADPNFNSVHAIAEDKKGNIWFGTDCGAVKYDGKTFRSYTEEDGLRNITVGRKSILVDKNGTVWVGTSGGVFRFNPSADNTGGKSFLPFDLLSTIKVKDIMEDKTGNIWFASQDNGVFRYDGKTIENIMEKEGLGDNYAGGMAQDKTGNFWFTMKDGICRYDPSASTGTDTKAFTSITTKDGLGGSEVWGIYIEKSGIIWITSRGSTTRYDPSIDISNPKAFTVFTEKDGINCCVQSMYQDKAGNMWWGAGAGLYRFDGKRFYQVKQNGPW
ncbi:MAG TPA: two-component regulator propeller domain-containing protein [Flavobacterium sp.]|uniref:ligand-binding sensor domain-containing protein n=1 Tax=Flavobacterium sp. TaxID=239 RepID=UPI002BE628B1|nr:two-component regulator propeller domain-containing protein [Flavobacterium sp.]HSD14807.1 two-component regulator propeller domain-containing protein [Flavobacterium sp.]